MAMRQLLTWFQKRSGRNALQFVERPHLAAIIQRSIIISVHSIALQRIVNQFPFLVEVSTFLIYVKKSQCQYLIYGIVASGDFHGALRRDSQLTTALAIGFEV